MSNNPSSQKAYSARPHHHGLSRRNTSITKLLVPKAHHRPGLQPRALSSPKVASLGKKRVPTEIDDTGDDTGDDTEDDTDDMASSFLQYCATCEKQIVVPNNYILYCSERCRSKDIGDSPDATLPLSPKRSPLTPLLDTPQPVVPAREPSTLATLGSKAPVQHSAKSDLDPTEWKPSSRGSQRAKSTVVLPTFAGLAAADGGNTSNRPGSFEGTAAGPLHARSSSSSTAALAFLASFHRAPENLAFSPRLSPSRSGARSLAGTPRAIARTAPGCFFAGAMDSGATQHSASTSPSLSGSAPGTPRENFDGEGKVKIRGVGTGSASSLKSLALPEEARNGEGLGLVGGVWMGEAKADGMDRVEGRLRKLLHGS